MATSDREGDIIQCRGRNSTRYRRIKLFRSYVSFMVKTSITFMILHIRVIYSIKNAFAFEI